MLRAALAACAFLTAAELLYLLWNKRKSNQVPIVDVIEFAGTGQWCNSDPCRDKRCSYHNVLRIVAYIDSAQVSLDLCLYILSLDFFITAISDAHARGVAVRVILDKDMALRNSKSVVFDNTGIQVRHTPTDYLMHHKFCLIDSYSRVDQLKPNSPFARLNRQLLIAGSLNWSKQAVYFNFEDTTVTSFDPYVEGFQNIFDRLWSSSQPLKAT